jgi:hypothetical protein
MTPCSLTPTTSSLHRGFRGLIRSNPTKRKEAAFLEEAAEEERRGRDGGRLAIGSGGGGGAETGGGRRRCRIETKSMRLPDAIGGDCRGSFVAKLFFFPSIFDIAAIKLKLIMEFSCKLLTKKEIYLNNSA